MNTAVVETLAGDYARGAADAWWSYVTTPRPWPPGNGDPQSAKPIYSVATIRDALADGDHMTLDHWPLSDLTSPGRFDEAAHAAIGPRYNTQGNESACRQVSDTYERAFAAAVVERVTELTR